jgi:hypothetical protein
LLIKIKNKKLNKFIVSERLYIGITDTINGFRSTLACCEVLQKGIQHVLVSQFNPSDPGKGIVKLLDNGDNILTRIQSTDAITAEYRQRNALMNSRQQLAKQSSLP